MHCCASECQHLHLLHRRGRFLLHLLQLLLLARTAALHLLQRLRLCRGLMPRLDLSCPAQWQLLLPCLPLVALLRVPRSSQPAAGAHTRQPGCDKISLGLGMLPTPCLQVQALTGTHLLLWSFRACCHLLVSIRVRAACQPSTRGGVSGMACWLYGGPLCQERQEVVLPGCKCKCVAGTLFVADLAPQSSARAVER